MESSPPPSTCPGRTGKGEPCPRPSSASGYCALHDPEQQRARGLRGGAAKAAAYRAEREERVGAIRMQTTDDVRALLARAVELAESDTGPQVARAGVLVRIATALLEVIRTTDLEREVAELRELLEARTGGRKERLQ